MTEAIKMSGIAALEEANLENTEVDVASGWTGAEVFLGVFLEDAARVLFVRADFLEELLFELLDEVFPERDLPVFAIISRYSLSP